MKNNIHAKVSISSTAKINNSILKYYSRLKDYSELHNSTLGKYSYISQYSIVNKSKIGKFCSIANGCYIGLWEHNTDVSTHSFYLYEHSGDFVKGYKNYDKDNIETIIGNDVWIGANAVVMKGVTISDGVIIGASAVVTIDVPAYAIAVGNPARVIKYRYNDKDINWLLKLKWWNFSRKKLKKIIDKNGFNDFKAFKKQLKD
ncbi:MAG: CatB-related O-acetyltransferase [Sulfurimonas sp.]|nr:CatB-related O-acetyltransferase [Sulfurimonas sp.]